MSRYPKATEVWFATLDRCQVCWTPRHIVERRIGGFQHLHIVPKSQRVCNERFNILGGCFRCHDTQTGPNNPDFPKLTVPMLMAVKLETDPDFYDPDELALIWTHGMLPQPRPLPIQYRDERLRNQPSFAA